MRMEERKVKFSRKFEEYPNVEKYETFFSYENNKVLGKIK